VKAFLQLKFKNGRQTPPNFKDKDKSDAKARVKRFFSEFGPQDIRKNNRKPS